MAQNSSDAKVVNEYFQWLASLINVQDGKRSYWLLAKAIHKMEYYWSVPNDDNRGADGKLLRDEFAYECYCADADYTLTGPCSILEMLIALSRRFEDMMADQDADDRTSQWFWKIMENLGLDKFTDDAYVDLSGDTKIEEILFKVLDRTYKKNGSGGLFPLKFSKDDQRKVEIWYQMSAYILENFYSEGQNV